MTQDQCIARAGEYIFVDDLGKCAQPEPVHNGSPCFVEHPDVWSIRSGKDKRTTVMIRNVPNKYTKVALLQLIDKNHAGTYDFFYLPIDCRNKCNLGYAFLNVKDPQFIVSLMNEFSGRRWARFKSDKVCEITYGRIQGKGALMEHFRFSRLMLKHWKYRPLVESANGQLGDYTGTSKVPSPSLPAEFPAHQLGMYEAYELDFSASWHKEVMPAHAVGDESMFMRGCRTGSNDKNNHHLLDIDGMDAEEVCETACRLASFSFLHEDQDDVLEGKHVRHLRDALQGDRAEVEPWAMEERQPRGEVGDSSLLRLPLRTFAVGHERAPDDPNSHPCHTFTVPAGPPPPLFEFDVGYDMCHSSHEAHQRGVSGKQKPTPCAPPARLAGGLQPSPRAPAAFPFSLNSVAPWHTPPHPQGPTARHEERQAEQGGGAGQVQQAQHVQELCRSAGSGGSATLGAGNFAIDFRAVLRQEDVRSTVMLRNVPNKYTKAALLQLIDKNHAGTYDFFYLPMDYRNKCNLGYAFLNLRDARSIVALAEEFSGKGWAHFNSGKVCEVTYARIQGKTALIQHFQTTRLVHKHEKLCPLVLP